MVAAMKIDKAAGLFIAQALQSKPQALGVHGEQVATELFKQNGYRVLRPGIKSGDLLVVHLETGEVNKIEVKTARRNGQGRWQFNMRKKGHTDARYSDYILLMAVIVSGRVVAFLIPSVEVSARSQVTLFSHPDRYAGKYREYRL